ncbi:MAG: 30S ribosomal protein S7 [Candidatus Levybacteria bacterium]|nr:30S ribosomal protein S7 [Candidatus Levybacteria bacterium]
MRHKKVAKRQIAGDKVYDSKLIAKFINKIMISGKKQAAERCMYKALEIIKAKGQDPVDVFEKALDNIGPKQEVKPRRVGGASYQIPMEVSGDRRMALAMRWIIQAARSRSSKDFHLFSEKLAIEFMDAAQNLGEAIKKRDAVERMAQANKAFAHFRW